jgi:RNA polymerase sigma factor (sigma-70 family)
MASPTPDWTSSTFRDALLSVVRRRVRGSDAEDLVQSALTEAVASPHRPDDPEATRRWIWGIVRHKIADHHRQARRESPDVPEIPVPAPEAEQSLLDWAVRELPPGMDARRTLEWLLREGEGETLEDIARSEQVPAPRVRQRVGRLRQHFRTRWAAQVAALAALGILAAALYAWLHRPPVHPTPPGPVLQVEDAVQVARRNGRRLREEALRACSQGHWEECLDGLDHARALDPDGDATPDVREARRQIADVMDAGPTSLPVTTPDAGPPRRVRRRGPPPDAEVSPRPPPRPLRERFGDLGRSAP